MKKMLLSRLIIFLLLMFMFQIVSAADDPSQYFFSQNDALWKNDYIIGSNGVSLGTIGGIDGIGCAMTCSAMVLKKYGVNTNPQLLNAFLNEVKGYDSNGFIDWSEPANYSSGRIQYKQSQEWKGSTSDYDHWTQLKTFLDQGYPVIVQVDSTRQTPDIDSHFVLVTSFNGGQIDNADNYYINDPWDLSYQSGKKLSYWTNDNGKTFFGIRLYHGPIFQIYDNVIVTTNVNVRTNPNPSSSEISDPDYPGIAQTGTTGRIIDEPVGNGGYIWWKVEYDAGYTGWSIQDNLRKNIITPGRSGGPDNFGYTFIDSKSSGGPAYNWIEISGTGNKILDNDDDEWIGNIPLGFFFNYYGTDYSQVAISNNGLLFSGGTTTEYVNEPIGNSPSVDGFIGPYWDDIVTWGSADAIYYETVGNAPNRMFVVEWKNNQHYTSSTDGITFEAILFEGSNNVKFQYQDVDFGTVSGAVPGDLPPYDNGGSATVGIESLTGTDGLQYSFNEQAIEPNLAILFKFPAFSGTNMHLSKNAPTSINRGNSLTYTLYFNNFGGTPASNVILTDTLPPEVEFISASDSGIYDSATQKVTWDIGPVVAYPSGRGSRNVIVKVPDTVTIGTVIQNTASISTSTLETRIDDNTATTSTTISGLNLPPEVSVAPIVGNLGGTPSIYWNIPITFSYHNPTATGVNIKIHLDDGGPDITGVMVGGPPDWTYSTSFYPRSGKSEVTYSVQGTSCSKSTSLPDGLHLPVSSGLIGLEQHLYNNNPGDGYVPPSGNFPVIGLVGVPIGINQYILDNGYAGKGAFAPHPSILSEKYYINMRWPDGVDWSPTQNHQSPNVIDSATYLKYAHKKVFITAPATGKSLIASIEESGPALWTGKDSGAPPEVFLALGVYPRGDGQHEPTIYTLNYEWADQNSQLGPCNPDITFIIYIDPAGYIYDVDTLDRVSDANVWLQRSDGQGGWGNVPTGQALPIMQPDVNPLTANANGQYQWNVLDGTYRVHVEASNYYPADSIVVNIPPPVFDLNIGLNRVPGTDKPPVADASGPTIGFVGDVLSFDGSASHDPYGRIVSYQWTFGDGDSAGGAYVTHTYTTPGYYETRLIVTDNGGLSDSKSILLTISLVPTPGLPVAVALITPNPGIVGQTIQFDGSSSYHQDPTKSIDSWSWDINNDGSYEIEGMEVLHSFSTAGSYPVKLQVSDNGDPEHFAETTLMVVIKDQNPVPEFPTVAFPAALLVGLIGAVFFIQRTRKH